LLPIALLGWRWLLCFHSAWQAAALAVEVLQLMQHGVYRMHRQEILKPRWPGAAKPWSSHCQRRWHVPQDASTTDAMNYWRNELLSPEALQ
jgi:hypothetical protein